jgi:hypothetical protein
METFFKNTSWYKKITRGFIDTSEPKKKINRKKNASFTRYSNTIK